MDGTQSMTDKLPADVEEAAERHNWRPEHIIALLVAIFAGIIVFMFTGDAEPFVAIGSGVGLGALSWILSYLHLRRGS